MLKSLCLVLALLSALGYVAFPVVQSYFVQVSALVYHVRMIDTAAAIGSDPDLKVNISSIGTAKVPVLQLQRMESAPPGYSFLRIVSDAGTFYVVVFFSQSWGAGQLAEFQSLIVPVLSLSSHAAFYYQGFSGKEISLGSY